jgi:hypothetical protein
MGLENGRTTPGWRSRFFSSLRRRRHERNVALAALHCASQSQQAASEQNRQFKIDLEAAQSQQAALQAAAAQSQQAALQEAAASEQNRQLKIDLEAAQSQQAAVHTMKQTSTCPPKKAQDNLMVFNAENCFHFNF